MRIVVPLFLCFSFLGSIQAQHAFMTRFQATLIPDGVYLEWNMIAGNTCLGIQIERADSNGEFQEIGSIDGVCGSLDEEIEFTFIDTSPRVGEVNTYRLILGLNGTSDVVSIEYFKVGEEGFSIRYDESSSQLYIRTLISHSKPFAVKVFDINGQEMRSGNLEGTGAEFSFGDMPEGMYIVQVGSQGRTIFSEKFVKVDLK